jgi:hypothetical protein
VPLGGCPGGGQGSEMDVTHWGAWGYGVHHIAAGVVYVPDWHMGSFFRLGGRGQLLGRGAAFHPPSPHTAALTAPPRPLGLGRVS